MSDGVPEDTWMSVGATRLHLRIWPGTGTPFLLLHGLASNCRTWEAVASLLSKSGHLVATVDQRGHGLSDKPAYGYGFDEVTADLNALVDELHLSERPVLAGQSWGGNVVLEFAARHPDRARGLVLVDGGFLELSSRPGASWEQTAIDLKPPPLSGTPRDQLAARISQMHPDWTEAGVEATLANFETLPNGTVRPWLTLDRHMAILRSLWEHHPSGIYGRIQEPVVLAAAADRAGSDWGEAKRVQVEGAARALPRCRVHWFEATDHDIHVHKPAELAALMLAALSGGFFG